MNVNDIFQLFSGASVFVVSLTGLFFGYLQWRGGGLPEKISIAAKNMVDALSDTIDAKDKEIDKLKALVKYGDDCEGQAELLAEMIELIDRPIVDVARLKRLLSMR